MDIWTVTTHSQYQHVDNVNFVLVEENVEQTNCYGDGLIDPVSQRWLGLAFGQYAII
jgi:hypothetical protein